MTAGCLPGRGELGEIRRDKGSQGSLLSVQRLLARPDWQMHLEAGLRQQRPLVYPIWLTHHKDKTIEPGAAPAP